MTTRLHLPAKPKPGADVPASRPSLSSSFAQNPATPVSAAPQLAHLNLSHSSCELSKGYSSGSPLHDIYGKQQPRYEPSLDNSSVTTDNSAQVETPPVSAAKVRAPSSWYSSELSAAILPEFPASSSQLQPITVLAIAASFRQVAAGFGGVSQSRWVPCTLVFTCFKVSAEEQPRHTGGGERSVAHIHVLAPPSAQQQRALPNITSIGSLRRPTKGSAPAFKPDASSRLEVERRLLTRFSSAEITRDYAHSEGRDLALRVLFGDSVDGAKASGEWLIEIKDMSQLQESVNQIKKTAIMINAEDLGYGHAIRAAFESPSVSADELAQKLSIHARAVAARREQKSPPTSDAPSESFRRLKVQDSPSSAASQELRRDSLDATQGAALARSRSAEDMRSSLPAASQVPLADTFSMPDARDEPNRLSTGSTSAAFALTSALAFPAPPSDLPPRRPMRAMPAPPAPAASQPNVDVNVNVVPPGLDESGSSTPLGAPTPSRSRSPSMSSSKRTLMAPGAAGTASIASNNSGSSTSRLRRLRGKPQVVDVMAEFSALEAERMPPAPEEEEEDPVRDDRARRIRFAQE